jgi:hypothetical protein
VDGQPVVEGQTRVELAGVVGRGVSFQFRGELRERVLQVVQELEHLVSREHVFHHDEAHEVQAEVARDRGSFYGRAEPGHMGRQAGLRRLVDAAVPG